MRIVRDVYKRGVVRCKTCGAYPSYEDWVESKRIYVRIGCKTCGTEYVGVGESAPVRAWNTHNSDVVLLQGFRGIKRADRWTLGCDYCSRYYIGLGCSLPECGTGAATSAEIEAAGGFEKWADAAEDKMALQSAAEIVRLAEEKRRRKEALADERLVDKTCIGCAYLCNVADDEDEDDAKQNRRSGKVGSCAHCSYILSTGTPRGCAAGKGCTRYEKRKKKHGSP